MQSSDTTIKQQLSTKQLWSRCSANQFILTPNELDCQCLKCVPLCVGHTRSVSTAELQNGEPIKMPSVTKKPTATWGADWRHLANTTCKGSVCSSDPGAFHKITSINHSILLF